MSHDSLHLLATTLWNLFSLYLYRKALSYKWLSQCWIQCIFLVLIIQSCLLFGILWVNFIISLSCLLNVPHYGFCGNIIFFPLLWQSLLYVFSGSCFLSSGKCVHSLRLCLRSTFFFSFSPHSLRPHWAKILPVSFHRPPAFSTTAIILHPDPSPLSGWLWPSCKEKAGCEAFWLSVHILLTSTCTPSHLLSSGLWGRESLFLPKTNPKSCFYPRCPF